MKNNLLLLVLLFLTVNLSAQIFSPLPDLTSYRVEYTRILNVPSSDDLTFKSTISSDDQMSDTLRVVHVGDWGDTVLANLWLDGRKTWLKVFSESVSSPAQLDYGVFFGKNFPLDEYFLLYDFDILDAASVGDTMVFETHLDDVSFKVFGIDTILINDIEKNKVLYRHSLV